ncbi:MAG: hypothetical protein ACRC9O_09445 [Plesiomonas sp.]|uniref:hypothetical protein n=1 Tax=Plesiomonas sp. TaxID=2486279 RepID=UPI003F36C576
MTTPTPQSTEQLMRYELYQLPSGAMVYQLKLAHHNEEPYHQICAHCYGLKRISILQPDAPHNGYKILVCSACNARILSEKVAASSSIKILSQPRRGWHDY